MIKIKMNKQFLIFLILLSNNIFTKNQLANSAISMAILEGSAPSQIINFSNSKLIRSNCSFNYLVGQPTTSDLCEVAKILKQVSDLRLVCDEKLHKFFVQQGFSLCPRIELNFPKDILLITPVLPDGISVQRVNSSEMIQKCYWYDRVLDWYGNVDDFLKQSFAYVVLDQAGNILAESYGAFIGGGACEIGIATHPDHRQCGYAKIAAEYAVIECKNRRLDPRWSCDCLNIGSLKTALRVGFNINRYYAFVTNKAFAK